MKKLFLSLVLVFFVSIVLYADIEGIVKVYKLKTAELIAVKDKDNNMSKSVLLKPDAAIVKKLMPEENVAASINTFILKTNNKNILFDAGLGSGNGGNMLNNMKKQGIKPKDIDIVYLTHMHGDHIGGLINKGKRVFPKAIVYVSKVELDYWLGPDNKRPPLAETVKNVQKAYGDDLKTFSWNDKAAIDEIKIIKAIGHTPGHTVYEINIENEKILIVGDIIHNLIVQMADTSISTRYDVDPVQAAKTRKAILDYAVKNKIKIAGMHIPFSGIGSVKAGKGSFDERNILFLPLIGQWECEGD
jgi:glyoxylase-like metal-dependent hydrolase (beta-lactamase superfamily II)